MIRAILQNKAIWLIYELTTVSCWCCIYAQWKVTWVLFENTRLKNTWWRHQLETFSALLAIMRGIHRSPVNSPHKDQWCGALMFSLICVWINGWVNNREAGNLRRYRAYYDVSLTNFSVIQIHQCATGSWISMVLPEIKSVFSKKIILCYWTGGCKLETGLFVYMYFPGIRYVRNKDTSESASIRLTWKMH